jgi:hypothetical protein
MGGMNKKRPTAIKGTMSHAKTSFSTKIFSGAIVCVVQYLAPLRYALSQSNVQEQNLQSTWHSAEVVHAGMRSGTATHQPTSRLASAAM